MPCVASVVCQKVVRPWCWSFCYEALQHISNVFAYCDHTIYWTAKILVYNNKTSSAGCQFYVLICYIILLIMNKIDCLKFVVCLFLLTCWLLHCLQQTFKGGDGSARVAKRIWIQFRRDAGHHRIGALRSWGLNVELHHYISSLSSWWLSDSQHDSDAQEKLFA